MSDTNGQPMEDILASIRRIITEDRPITAPGREPDSSEEPEDVLELGDAPDTTPPPPSIFPPPPAGSSFTPVPPVSGLMSGEAAAASRKALEALSGITLDPQAAENTLDGLVREMLKPILKDWLDAHLPELVERVVTREIARLGR